MRDFNVPDMAFTDVNGNIVILKEMREYPTDTTIKEKYKVRVGDTLDLIAVNEYGDGSESDCYKIYDQNVETLVDNSFSLQGIKQLEIPN